MEGPECVEQFDPQDKEAPKLSRWSEHCKTFLIRDSHGAIKELIFPRALDLDRPKRERTIFSSGQLGCLEEEFNQNQYLVGKERSAVATRLGLSETQVKVWFQNRRTKHKKDNERCGEGKDFQAESKAARNVLKLLEYKTALNYSTLLGQTPAQLNTHRNMPTGTMDFLACPSPDTANDPIQKILDANFKQQDVFDHSLGKTKGVGFEAPAALVQVKNRNVVSNRDITTNDFPIEMIPKCSYVSSSSESFQKSNDALLHQHINHHPATQMDILKSLGDLEGTQFKTTDVSNKGLRTYSSYCVERLLKDSDLQTDSIASEDLSQDYLEHSEECIVQGRGKFHEEVPTRIQGKKHGNREVNPVRARFHPYADFTHPAAETSQEPFRNEEHTHNTHNVPYRLPPLEESVLENKTCIDNKPVHGTTSREIHREIFPSPYSNRSIGQYFSNVINCPNNIHNTYLSYQPIMVSPGNTSHNAQQLPYMKHYNYYVPNFYGPGTNDSQSRLQILQHVPDSNPYGDGRPQRSYSSYTMSTPQTSFLSQPTVHGLSSQYHGYHMGTPFS